MPLGADPTPSKTAASCPRSGCLRTEGDVARQQPEAIFVDGVPLPFGPGHGRVLSTVNRHHGLPPGASPAPRAHAETVILPLTGAHVGTVASRGAVAAKLRRRITRGYSEAALRRRPRMPVSPPKGQGNPRARPPALQRRRALAPSAGPWFQFCDSSQDIMPFELTCCDVLDSASDAILLTIDGTGRNLFGNVAQGFQRRWPDVFDDLTRGSGIH